MRRMNSIRALVLMIVALAAVAAGCGGSSSGTAVTNDDVNGLWSSYHTEAGGVELGPELWAITQHGTTNDLTVTDSMNATLNGTINGSSVTITRESPEGVFTLTGTASGNTMSGTYSGTDGSSGTWRMVKVKLISATTTTTTIPVNGTATFTATAENYDDTTKTISGGANSGLSWTVSDATIASVDVNGVVKGIKAGAVDVTASYRGMTSAGVTLTVTSADTPPPTNTGGGTTAGTLTVSLDLSSAATVTTSPALVSAQVYTAGSLVAVSPTGFALMNKSGSFTARQPANPSTAVSLNAGQYLLYAYIDDNGNGSMDEAELGWAGTITINSHTTRNLTSADFVQTTGVKVSVNGSAVPDGKNMRCDWLAPGGAWQVDANTSTVIQGFSLAVGSTFSGGAVITDTNTPLIPIGRYDLHCWVDTDSNSAKNTGDFFGSLNTPTLVVTGTPISLTAVP